MAYIDIEINSLEDAYIQIAKEEEKLLKKLERDGMRRFSEAQNPMAQRFSLNGKIEEEKLELIKSQKEVNA